MYSLIIALLLCILVLFLLKLSLLFLSKQQINKPIIATSIIICFIVCTVTLAFVIMKIKDKYKEVIIHHNSIEEHYIIKDSIVIDTIFSYENVEYKN